MRFCTENNRGSGVHPLSKEPLGENIGLGCKNWLICVVSQSNRCVTFLAIVRDGQLRSGKATGIFRHSNRPPVGAIHESPLRHTEHGQRDRIPAGAIDELPLPRKELVFFLLPVPPFVPRVSELQSATYCGGDALATMLSFATGSLRRRADVD